MTLHSGDISLLNGQGFHAEVSEKPILGTTEDWDLVNLTSSDHPIHLHLVQFQVQSRKTVDVGGYQAAWTAANGEELPLKHPTKEVSAEPYYTGTQELSVTESVGKTRWPCRPAPSPASACAGHRKNQKPAPLRTTRSASTPPSNPGTSGIVTSSITKTTT